MNDDDDYFNMEQYVCNNAVFIEEASDNFFIHSKKKHVVRKTKSSCM